jgi:6-phosphogluconolactonase
MGSIPRSFGITPDGEFMLVACQDTHKVNVFKVDKESGKLMTTGQSANIPSPMKVHFTQFKMPLS